MRFRREEIKSFHATDYAFDRLTGTVFLRYAFELDAAATPGRAVAGTAGTADAPEGLRESINFEERIELGGSLRLEATAGAEFERVVRLIHAAAGTSYYKAAAPAIVSIDSRSANHREQGSSRISTTRVYGNSLSRTASLSLFPWRCGLSTLEYEPGGRT